MTARSQKQTWSLLLWPSGLGTLSMLCLVLLTAGCSETAQNQQETGIVTSFNAMRLIVEPLAGDLSVTTLLPAGVSPHAYSPRPSEIARLNRASLVVFAHPQVDGWISNLGDIPQLSVFEESDIASETQTSLPNTASEGHDHRGQDPHVWNDPAVVRSVLPPVANALCGLYPDRCASFRRQATVFSASLIELQDSLILSASSWRGDNPDQCFITAQPFIDRFLVRFGFSFVGPLSGSPDVEPSPSSLAAFIDEASQHSCNTLIVQDALENRLERRLAAEQGWRVVSVDPLGHSVSTYEAYLSSLMSTLTASEAPEPPPPAP